MSQIAEESSKGIIQRAIAKASYPVAFRKGRGCRDLDGDAGSQNGVSAGQTLNSRSNAKAALLAAMEVHTCLTQLENECNKSYKENSSNIPDWKISTKAAAAAEEEECSEFTSVPSRTSSGMVEAISIKPDSPELDVNFDGHDFGFFGDVGAKHFYRPTSNFEEPSMNAISEENIMPWDM